MVQKSKMEEQLYLVRLAGQLPIIRERLGWTQEELAKRLGLSRANIVLIERQPHRMGKTTALALFTAVFGELSLKKSQYNALDFSLWEEGDSQSRGFLLKQLNGISWGRKKLASILVIGSRQDPLVNETLQLKFLLDNPEKTDFPSGLAAEDIKEILNMSIQRIEDSICESFGLERPDVGTYLNNLEDTVYKFSDIFIEFSIGDISAQDDIDIIVNATDRWLTGGGGGDKAIRRAAGPELERECEALQPIEPGEVVATQAYKMPNKLIIHCVGPIYGVDNPAHELLRSCYYNALLLADQKAIQNGWSSIAFPAISTGAFGYPIRQAAQIALETVRLSQPSLQAIKKIRFVLFDSYALSIYTKTWDSLIQDQLQ